jgi:YesN/AraC family two-component response regulator
MQSYPAEKKRILVVEDDAELINLHRSYLSDLFTVDIESSGVSAIQYLKKNRHIDLALIDLMLPDISGIDVLRELKKSMPCVPTIIVTAFGSEDVAVKAFRCGARDYVKKPFTYDELIERVNFCLSLNAIEQPKHRTALIESESTVSEGTTYGQAASRNYKIQRALHFIHNNYETDISLDRVAKTVCLSRFHFSRLFKEMTGLTYQSYINYIRIEQAKKLLNDDALSVTGTGYAVGYSDLTHFERIFKKIVGLSPTQHRRQRPNEKDESLGKAITFIGKPDK